MVFPFFFINCYKNSKELEILDIYRNLIFRCESNFFELFKIPSLFKNKRFFGHAKNINDLFFLKKNKFLTSFCQTTKIKIWEKLSGRILRSLDFNSMCIKKVLIDQESQLLVCIYKKKITIWNLWTGILNNIVPFSSNLKSKPIFYKDTKILLIRGKDNYLYFIDIVQNIILKKLLFQKNSVFIFDNQKIFGKILFQKFNLIVFFNGMLCFSKILRTKRFQKKNLPEFLRNLYFEKFNKLLVIIEYINPKVLMWDILSRLLIKNIYFYNKKDLF